MFGKDLNERTSATASLPREVAIPGEAAARAPAPAEIAKRKVALFVAHGMGQQIRFETMDAVAEGLARAAELPATAPGTAIRAVTAMLSGEKLQRIEMDLPAPGGPVEVHIYEGYWAPLTEGQVTMGDVLSFLLRGGWNGVRNAGSDFYRWIFARAVNYGKQRKTAAWLVLALLVVLSVLAVNLLVAVVFADRVLGRVATGEAGGGAFTDATFTALTTLVGGWVIASALVGLVLYAAHLAKPDLPPADRPSRAPWIAFLNLLLVLWVLATVALGLAVALTLLGWLDIEAWGLQPFNAYSLWVWGGLVGVSWLLRNLLIQYPGDVAAYIASHTLDRFYELRGRIKQEVARTAKAIYADPAYEGVVLVGHSLGSVVVYDALNALIMDDELSEPKRQVVARTKLLLTFGSPLDKVALIFALQWARTTATREALAASFQPLILDYERFRGIRWVNLYSPSDLISSPLGFFDDPQAAQHAARFVANERDPAASTPLLAHVEYWKNRLLYERIYEGLCCK